MTSVFQITKRIVVAVFIICTLSLFLIVFSFTKDIANNVIRLLSLEERTKAYKHLSDSQLVQKISMVGNFAPASNQCGIIVAQLRTTTLPFKEVYNFYKPILTNVAYEKGPPYHEVNLFVLTDGKDVDELNRSYSDLYEQIVQSGRKKKNAYLLITAERGYPPNYDPRCH